MKWIAAKVTFDSPDPDPAVDLIADIFYGLDLKGVVVDDADADPGLDWGDDAVPPARQHGVTGYFADTTGAADRCKALEASLQRLNRMTGIAAEATFTRIDEQDWAEAWKEFFWPGKITDTIVVKPTWREYAAAPHEIVLEIDPGMAFGTGTHPTTALCIGMIERYLKPADDFLDVGTGSGILMMAAARLGAGRVRGVDNDPVAVEVAEKNLILNRIQGFEITAGNLVDDLNGSFDVVAANILAEVILELLPDVVPVLTKRGVFICSGIVSTQKAAVLAGLHSAGFTIVEVSEQDGWIAIAASPG
jgi:ribosomal protein L11 methyltransferase